MLLDKSSKRLQTDYLDLYQLLARAQNKLFWTRGFTLQEDEWEDNIHEVLTIDVL
jgi:aryl-alcohol dehydrogenase-like predicted oxidoreductase